MGKGWFSNRPAKVRSRCRVAALVQAALGCVPRGSRRGLISTRRALEACDRHLDGSHLVMLPDRGGGQGRIAGQASGLQLVGAATGHLSAFQVLEAGDMPL
jgi:hypothetical protein